MSADHDAEKELIALSKDQRAFFEKAMPGMKLYPYQEELIAAVLSGKAHRIFIGGPRRGKTLTMRAIEQFFKENPNAKPE